MKQLVKTAHSVGQNSFHLTWTPRCRCPVFRYENMRDHCERALRDVAASHKIIIHELCIEPDHIHIFVDIPNTMSVCKAFQLLKGGSSYLIRKKLPTMRWRYKALWGKGKFYRSVGSVTDEAVRHYINDSHHISAIPKSQTKLTA